MNIAKYKGNGALQIVKHIERDRPKTAVYSNEQIDEERTHLNYSVQIRTQNGNVVKPRKFKDAFAKARAEHKATTGKEARSDAVSLVSAVIQLPREYCTVTEATKLHPHGIAFAKDEEQAKQFFTEAMRATLRHFKVRPDMFVSAEVHLDETTPHVHVCWVPLKDGKLDAKHQVCRSALNTYHDAVDKHLRECCPWYRGGLVSEHLSDRVKAFDNLTIREIRKATADLKRIRKKTEDLAKQCDLIERMPKTERDILERFLKSISNDAHDYVAEFEKFRRDFSVLALAVKNKYDGGRSR